MRKKIKSFFSLNTYLESLVARGQHYFITNDVVEAVAMKKSSLSVAISRLAKKGRVRIVKTGFGIILGPAGELHPSFYIDKMMQHQKCQYYVGLLSAAAYWGASHQASMSYQVITDRPAKPIKFAKGRIEFAAKQLTFSKEGVLRVAGIGGYYLVSSPELTVIDLLRFPRKAGHLNNVATVLGDLVEKWDNKRFVAICENSVVPTVTLQRLGFLLEVVLGKVKVAAAVEKVLRKRSALPALLSVSKTTESKKSLPFNQRWRLYINTKVEPDE